jgi:hypothetical protein
MVDMTDNKPIQVEGIDYTPEGIESVREALVEYRSRAMANWPEGIEMTLVLSHAIAQLAYLKEYLSIFDKKL